MWIGIKIFGCFCIINSMKKDFILLSFIISVLTKKWVKWSVRSVIFLSVCVVTVTYFGSALSSAEMRPGASRGGIDSFSPSWPCQLVVAPFWPFGYIALWRMYLCQVEMNFAFLTKFFNCSMSRNDSPSVLCWLSTVRQKVFPCLVYLFSSCQCNVQFLDPVKCWLLWGPVLGDGQ